MSVAHGQIVPFGALSPSGHNLFFYGDTVSLTAFVAQYGHSSISGDLVIPSSVTVPIVVEVGYDYNADTMITQTLTFTFTVTSIGSNAFRNCTGLTSVSISNSVTSIDSYAFSGCTGLTSVSIPNSVTSISNEAFSGCTGIHVLEVPSGVTYIGYEAFRGIRHVVYAGDADGYDAFYGTTRHRAYEDGLFYYDTAKTILQGQDGTISGHLVIPSTVRKVSSSAFAGDSNITSLTIPASVDTIEGNAFFGTGLTSLTIPYGVKYIGSSAFSCPNLTTLNYNATRGYFSGGIFQEVQYTYNPETGDYVSETIGANITTLTIGNAVTYIPNYFMEEMSSLTQLTIPASVDTIGAAAFYGTGLTSLTIPYGVKYIGSSAFSCPNLTTLRFCARRCNANSFAGDNLLGGTPISNLTIGDSVEYIPDSFLSGDTLLTSLTIPASVKNIGSEAFSRTRLTAVTIPATVDTIGYDAFAYIRTLENIYYNAPDAYHGSSERSPFYRSNGCYWEWDDATQTEIRICPETTPLTLTIGNNVRSLPQDIFAMLPISTVTLPDSLQTVGNRAFSNCDSLTTIIIPDAVTSIGMAAFSSCGNLQTVTIGNGVVSIGEFAFGNTPVRRLTIGSSVASIGSQAFSAMTNPDTIFMLPTVPPAITVNTFQDMPTNARIMVPCGTLQDYQDANYWSAFTRMAEDPSCFTLITVGSNDLNKGTVAGGGRYSQGSVATLSALAKKDFAFAGWADGNNDNPRLVLVSGDASYTANFSSMTGGVVHDTTVVTLTDTLFVRDTLFVGDGDTLIVYRDIHDTIYITDTIYIERIVHDTVYITDTVYVGVDDVQTVNYMLYQQGGQIVVEGAEGSPVTVYDAVGRLLATRRDTYGPVRFDAPAAGTYLVRVGSAAARRIVIVR